MNKKSILKLSLLIILVITILTIGANYIINRSSNAYIFSSINDVPYTKTGLLLGTSKYLSNGYINLYFKNRINATVELFKSNKIKFIIISGDNSKKDYNEPLDMKNELLKNGIPDSVIYLDYAGFRTFDSVIRAKKIFSQETFVIISQKFHNQRAVYIARKYNIEAFGYNAKDVSISMGFKTNIRELFARLKVFTDMIIDRQPKYLGEKVNIGK